MPNAIGAAATFAITLAVQGPATAMADNFMNQHEPLNEIDLTIAVEAIDQLILPNCSKNTLNTHPRDKNLTWGQPCWVVPHKLKSDDSGYIPFGFATTKNNLVESVLVPTAGVRFQNHDFKILTKMFGKPREMKEREVQNFFGAKFTKMKAEWTVPGSSANLFGQNQENKPLFVFFISCCDNDRDPILTEGHVFIISQNVKMDTTLEDDE